MTPKPDAPPAFTPARRALQAGGCWALDLLVVACLPGLEAPLPLSLYGAHLEGLYQVFGEIVKTSLGKEDSGGLQHPPSPVHAHSPPLLGNSEEAGHFVEFQLHLGSHSAPLDKGGCP